MRSTLHPEKHPAQAQAPKKEEPVVLQYIYMSLSLSIKACVSMVVSVYAAYRMLHPIPSTCSAWNKLQGVISVIEVAGRMLGPSSRSFGANLDRPQGSRSTDRQGCIFIELEISSNIAPRCSANLHIYRDGIPAQPGRVVLKSICRVILKTGFQHKRDSCTSICRVVLKSFILCFTPVCGTYSSNV